MKYNTRTTGQIQGKIPGQGERQGCVHWRGSAGNPLRLLISRNGTEMPGLGPMLKDLPDFDLVRTEWTEILRMIIGGRKKW